MDIIYVKKNGVDFKCVVFFIFVVLIEWIYLRS